MSEMLPVIILAGGLATRLRPITEKIPKALVEINGEPFIAHQLRLLRSQSIRHVVLSVAYKGEMIRDYVGDGTAFGLLVEYVFDGPTYLGTGGAVRQALPLVGDSFFTLYGDSYLTCDFAAVQRSFVESGRAALMTVFRNEGLFDTSNVLFTEGQIRVYDKRNLLPEMKHIDYGLGLFRSSAFSGYPAGEPLDLAFVYQDVLRANQLQAFEVPNRFYEIGTVQGIQETAEFLKGNPL